MAEENENKKTEVNVIKSKYIHPLTDFGFKKLFLEIAEIKHLTPEEMETYKKSLENNYYVRDIANFARKEGRMEGRMEGILKVASNLLLNGMPIEEVMYLTELSREQVLEVLDKLPKS